MSERDVLHPAAGRGSADGSDQLGTDGSNYYG